MNINTSQQVSATYARNHFSEVMDKARNEGMQVVIHRSEIPVIVIKMDDFEKITAPPAKPKKHKKFNLEEIQRNNYFDKYIGCWDKEFGDLTSVQIAKKWTDYVD